MQTLYIQKIERRITNAKSHIRFTTDNDSSKNGILINKMGNRGAKRRKKSIAGKVMKLISNRIHYRLDNALKKQKEAFYPSTEYGKVIPFRKTK